MLNAVSAFNGIVDAGRKAITNAQSIEDISELNKRTLNAAQTANSLAVYGQMRIGELLAQIPKVSANQYTTESAISDVVEKPKPKTETVRELGFSKDQVSDYQNLAKNPEVVEQVLKEAQASGKFVSMAEMQRKIKEAKLEGRRDANRDLQMDVERARNEAAAVKSELAELRNQTESAKSQQRLLDYSYQFCSICHVFLKDAGGLSFIAEQVMDLPPKELADYKKAIHAVLAWAQNLSEFIGG